MSNFWGAVQTIIRFQTTFYYKTAADRFLWKIRISGEDVLIVVILLIRQASK